MASQGQQQTLPAPTAASVLRFLRTCPMLWGLDDDTLTPLAKALSLRHPDSLRRYDADHRLFANEVPDRNHPLRFVTHGRANWSSSHTTEQKGAWILTPGSCFGLGTVNDWAEQRDLADTWTRSDLPSVRCQAEGVMWVLELAPDQFEPVFTASPALLGRLLAHYPTEVNAPDVVAAMKATPQFGRAAVQNLYRLLEGAPFVRFNGGGKVLQFMAQEQQEPMLLQAPVMSQEYDDPQAMYFVVHGEMRLTVDEQTVDIGVGEFAGQDLFAPAGDVQSMSWPSADGECQAIVLTRGALERAIRAAPGLAKTLGPLSQTSRVQP